MDVYIGLDVSLVSTAVYVLGERGRIVTGAQFATTPEALVGFIGMLAPKTVDVLSRISRLADNPHGIPRKIRAGRCAT